MKNVIITATRKGDWWDVWTKAAGFLSRLPRAGAVFRSANSCFQATGAPEDLCKALAGLQSGREIVVKGRYRVQLLGAFRRAVEKSGDPDAISC